MAEIYNKHAGGYISENGIEDIMSLLRIFLRKNKINQEKIGAELGVSSSQINKLIQLSRTWQAGQIEQIIDFVYDFETNNSQDKVLLDKKMVLGLIEAVQEITKSDGNQRKNIEMAQEGISQTRKNIEEYKAVLKEILLNGLSEEIKKKMIKLL